MPDEVDPSARLALVRVNEALRETGKQQLDGLETAAAQALLDHRLVMTGESLRSEVFLPAAVNMASAGFPVHVVTRDEPQAHTIRYEWHATLQAVGLTSDVIRKEWSPGQRRQTYSSDVIFGSGLQFCSDAICSHAWSDPASYWRMPMGLAVIVDGAGTLLYSSQDRIQVHTVTGRLAGGLSLESWLRRYPGQVALLPPISDAALSSILPARRRAVAFPATPSRTVLRLPSEKVVGLQGLERRMSRPLDEATWALFRAVDRAMSSRPFLPVVERAARWLDEPFASLAYGELLSRRREELGDRLMDRYARRVAVGYLTVAWSACLKDLLNARPAVDGDNRGTRRTVRDYTVMARSVIRETIQKNVEQILDVLLRQPVQHVRDEVETWTIE